MELTPKEKARELRKEFYQPIFDIDNGVNVEKDLERYNAATQCAIIAVNEIIKQWEYIDTYIANGMGKLNLNLKYWNEVKAELENI